MVFLRTGIIAALAACHLLGSTLAVPLADKLRSLTPGARGLLKRTIPAAPRFIVYDDAGLTLPSPDQLKGYNVYALSFWTTSGATDMALTWQNLSPSQRQEYIQEYNAAGISLIVSAFGELDKPTTNKHNAADVAEQLSSWVLQYGLQGVDIDYEDYDAFQGGLGFATIWLGTLTRQLRLNLPQGEYILTHAPIAPLFTPNTWNNNGYLGIHKDVGSMIDWYNIQFYNQGPNEYNFCSGLLHQSSSDNPETSLFQIANNGVDLNKLVIGKPATVPDAAQGFMDAGKLAWCVSQAHQSGWNAGVMVYELVHAPPSWIATVRGSTF